MGRARRSRMALALAGAAAGALMIAAGTAAADPRGRIIFLGWTENRQHSIWLSGVEAGQFFVVFPETGVRYDSWTQERTGLRLTVSSEVREYGGTHNLFTHIVDPYSEYDNFVDSDDQRPGRFIFPDHFDPPSLPERPKPPDPELPTGVTPTLPGGVQPPVGTLPPTGVTPTLPGGVQPPIGTLPPTGVTPTLPGGVQPPVGTLPPTGVTPTLPGGVQPPVGTLPPTGVTPTLPGGVQPPVGTLPPTGVTPTLPGGVQPPVGTLPPMGVTPTLPGGVQPPVGALPPTGVTPTLPGGVKPPVGTLPPTGVTPTLPGAFQRPPGERPGAITAPGLSQSQGAVLQEQSVRLDAAAFCAAARDGRLTGVDPATVRLACEQADAAASRWTGWADASYYDITDGRHGLETEGSSSTLTLGVDHQLSAATVFGVSMNFNRGRFNSFGGALRQTSEGYGFAPYVSQRLGRSALLLDATLSFTFSDNRQDILMFSGAYDAFAMSTSIGVSGQSLWRGIQLRPRVSVNYSRTWNDAFSMRGTLAGQDLNLERPSQHTDFGALLASVEASRTYVTRSGRPITPYVELGLQYAFERPNDGDILTPTLESVSTTAVTGSIRFGVRARVTSTTNLIASGGYSSIGDRDLSLWEWRLYLSRRF